MPVCAERAHPIAFKQARSAQTGTLGEMEREEEEGGIREEEMCEGKWMEKWIGNDEGPHPGVRPFV